MNSTRMSRAAVIRYALSQSEQLWRFTIHALAEPKLTDDHDRRFASYVNNVVLGCDHSVSNTRLFTDKSNRDARAVIRNLCRNVGRIYDAPYVSISTNGSSGGLLTLGAALPIVRPKASIALIDRLCHRSAYGALVNSGYDAVHIHRDLDQKWKIHTPIRAADVIALGEKYGPSNIAFVLIVAPSYEGLRSIDEERKIYDYCRAQAQPIPFIIDGAWAACHGIARGFPASPIAHADAAIVSLHKKGLAPSPIAALLLREKGLATAVRSVCDLGHQTTSPPIHLLAVAEHRAALQLEGAYDETWQQCIVTADSIRSKIRSAVDPRIYPVLQDAFPDLDVDPLHLLLDIQDVPASGAKLAATLSDLCSRCCEKANDSHLLFLISPGDVGREDAFLADLKNSLATVLKGEEAQ